MSLAGSTNEQKIWNYLIGKGLNACGVAGLMGNLYAESGLNPKNLQNSYESKLGYTDDSYTAAVDNGSYANFAKDSAGYGLAQWTYSTRKANLLAYAKAQGKSVGDLETQLGFLYKELSESYTSVLSTLKNAASILVASNAVLTKFERPADQGSSVQAKRAGYGQTYYDKYAGASSSTTEAALRKKVVDIAVSYLGCKESDGSHKKIIDLYNSHKPLARGYAVKYTDAWCSTFASAVAIAAGLTDIIPTECGCEKHIQLFKNMGSWQENDAYVPGLGDYIFYDWDDSGSGDCTGSADHVGIVTAVSGTSITVIEGNKSNAVGYRTMQVNGKYIRGYGTPDYAGKAKSSANTVTNTSTATNTGTTSTTTAPSTDIGTAYAVGDVVKFTGTKHYTSSSAASGVSCKAGTAKVTQVAKGAKHPYHLVKVSGGGSTVYGWVDAADISGKVSSTSTSSIRTHTVVKGDTLSALASKYGTTVAKIVAANKSKYSKITANYIVVGWVLTIPN